MIDVRSRPEKVKGPFGRVRPPEEHHRRAERRMVLISLSGRALGAGDRLALPVERRGADRIVPVAGIGREAPGRLVERECEQTPVRTDPQVFRRVGKVGLRPDNPIDAGP